jgi:hypothetical protein
MTLKDERLKRLNEILSGIKVLKLYAWEPSMERIIKSIRKIEILQIKRQFYFGIIQDIFFNCSPIFVSKCYYKR